MKFTPKKAAVAVATVGLLLGGLTACSDADTASRNISTDADNFKILRRIVFVNGITDAYLLSIEGYCSLGNDRTDTEVSVTCKVPGGYKKDFVGISDNVTYVVEQLDAANVSVGHYKTVFKPSLIVPEIEVR